MNKTKSEWKAVWVSIVLWWFPSKAQEVLLPLRSMPLEAPIKAAQRSALSLPFIDDFSYEGPVPDPQRWVDRQAYVSYTYGINPPSLGAVTLDGLNENGLPYDTTSYKLNVIGGADTLTSQPLLLGLLAPADSVYLSFFYQAGGLADFPNTAYFNNSNYGISFGDSLVLEFKDAAGIWKKVWATDGVMGPTPFTQVLIPIKSPAFFHNDFQFRFRNYATLVGQYDCWHIDYVRVDKNRSAANDVLNDAAMQYRPTSLLGHYRSMPWNQFYAYQNKERAAHVFSSIRINRTQPTNITTQMAVINTANGQSLYVSPQNAYNLPAQSSTPVQHATTTLSALSGDTITLLTKFYLIPGFSGDVQAANDTAYSYTVFSNILAYDDGTAEGVYRLLGSPASLALRFVVNAPDTLRGMQIYFPRTEVDFTNQLINLYVWKSLNPEDSLLRDELIFPAYGAGLDDFVFYRFSRPLYVEDTFYIGWQQVSLLTDMKTDVGFDRNDTSMQHLFFNVNGTWQSSQLPGAIMLRAVIGKEIPFGVGMQEMPPLGPYLVFPNPTRHQVQIAGECSRIQSVDFYDVTGRWLSRSAAYGEPIILDTSHLPRGCLIMVLRDNADKIIFRARLFLMP